MDSGSVAALMVEDGNSVGAGVCVRAGRFIFDTQSHTRTHAHARTQAHTHTLSLSLSHTGAGARTHAHIRRQLQRSVGVLIGVGSDNARGG